MLSASVLWLSSLLLSSPLQASPPSDHTLVYYNARMALREDEAVEAVKLWLLRNALEDATTEVSPHDGDFHSVTWAALGELGLCPDGLQKDSEGAGIWPVAMHNQIVRTLGRRRATPQPRTFDAYQVDRQQRTVAINDVLGSQELSTVRLARGRCVRPYIALVDARESPLADLRDRQVAARVLRRLLERSRETLQTDLVKGTAAIEARLFDLDLQLTALAEREARIRAREQAQQGRIIGLSRESLAALRRGASASTLDEETEAARILRDSTTWPVSEWMSLSPDRRQFLFDHSRKQAEGALATAALDAVALGILDEVLANGEGAAVEQWIARVTDGERSSKAVWDGDRGAAILALTPEDGFSGRSVIALHRGVHQLERGDLSSALRSLAFALQHASESPRGDAVAQLSRRWLAWISGRFELTDDLLTTLHTLVPRRDFSMLLDDLMWRAALHADAASYSRGLSQMKGSRGASQRRQVFLTPLAQGDRAGLERALSQGMRRSPSETVRFCKQLMDHLEREDAAVRRDHIATITVVRGVLAPWVSGQESGRATRTATEVDASALAQLEGLGALPEDLTAAERARALAPGGEVFVGNLRLAPADTLPWPFQASTPAAPSVFSPFELKPVEWRSSTGELVFGWTISG